MHETTAMNDVMNRWAGSLLAGAAGAVVLYLTRGPGDLSFQDVREVTRIAAGKERPSYTFTDFYGDRAYLLSVTEEGLEECTSPE